MVEVELVVDVLVSWVYCICSLVLMNVVGEFDCFVFVLYDVIEWVSVEECFECIFNVNLVLVVICWFDDLCYVKVNQGFFDMMGYVCDDVFGCLVYEVDVFEQVEWCECVIEWFGEGVMILQMEVVFKFVDGSIKVVVVVGQLIDMNGEVCMLFMFMDFELCKQVECVLM